MRKIILSIWAVASLSLLTAQTTITNGSMESWTGSGSTMEPTQWNSTKSAGGSCGICVSNAAQTCWRDTSSLHGGTYCAKVVTGSTFGTVVNGALTTGQVTIPSFTKAEGFIQTVTTDPNYRMSFVGRPDSLVFWYRYTAQGSDYPKVEARIHMNGCEAPEIPVNNNHLLDTANIVARALWSGTNTTVANWTRVAVPFVYRNSTTPQYILVTCTSSGDQTGGTQNSTLWLDDFEAIYNPTIAIGTINPVTYYVSAVTGVAVSVPYTLSGTFNGGNTITAQLSDASGSFASPVAIGSVSSTGSGTVNAVIPAGTPAGSGYRIRVVSSNPALASTDNGSDIAIVPCSNAIAPTAPQDLAAGTSGTPLSVSESPAAVSHEWKYSTTSGSGYVSFGTAQTGSTYTPDFATAGTYYVVCVSTFPGSLTVTSNEVQVNVVGNSVAPATSQSLLINSAGNTLSVTETPAGTSREWKYSTTSGSGYVSFGSPETATTYTPNFSSAGNYYVVCQSVINGLTAISNEVLISVSSVTLSTGTISGSPFAFSASAPDAVIAVPYTVSSAFNGGNTFTAQLSDANGSFTAPANIGSVSSTTSGTISASIPAVTAAGTGYRIRVVADNPSVFGTDNGNDLVIDQFHNAVAPPASQSILHSTNGTPVQVTASQAATQEWQYSTTSGSGYQSFGNAETGNSYTPNFAIPGTYYVVCKSVNQYNDTATSNEVEIQVQNGSTITTSAVSGSPYYVSFSANEQVNVSFTSDVVFNPGNVFKAELSDENGSFSNPVEIGTLTGTTTGPITAMIPNSSPAGSGFRIRVVSTDPAIVGSDNGSDLQIIPFEVNVTPSDTQWIASATDGNSITASATQSCTYHWLYTEVSGIAYAEFNPVQTSATYVPHFNVPNTYYVICKMTNTLSDEVTSQEVVVIVQDPNGLDAITSNVLVYATHHQLVTDLRNTSLQQPELQLVNVTGQIVLQQRLTAGSVNTIPTFLSEGLYFFRLSDGDKVTTGKLMVR